MALTCISQTAPHSDPGRASSHSPLERHTLLALPSPLGPVRSSSWEEEGCHLKGTPAWLLLFLTSPVNTPRHFTCLSCYFPDLGVG